MQWQTDQSQFCAVKNNFGNSCTELVRISSSFHLNGTSHPEKEEGSLLSLTVHHQTPFWYGCISPYPDHRPQGWSIGIKRMRLHSNVRIVSLLQSQRFGQLLQNDSRILEREDTILLSFWHLCVNHKATSTTAWKRDFRYCCVVAVKSSPSSPAKSNFCCSGTASIPKQHFLYMCFQPKISTFPQHGGSWSFTKFLLFLFTLHPNKGSKRYQLPAEESSIFFSNCF